VIAEIDAEIAKHQAQIAANTAQIAKLQQAKELLSGSTTPKAGRGRPKGSKNLKSTAGAAPTKAKRNLSPEGRAKIQAAMKLRWAKQRGEAS